MLGYRDVPIAKKKDLKMIKNLKANTINTYVENGITVTVLRPAKAKKYFAAHKHQGRTRTASDFAYMHRTSRK